MVNNSFYLGREGKGEKEKRKKRKRKRKRKKNQRPCIQYPVQILN